MSKPSLYARLSKGTKVFLESFFVAPSGCWAYCYATVEKDLGEEIVVKVTQKEAVNRGVRRNFTIYKNRVREIIS